MFVKSKLTLTIIIVNRSIVIKVILASFMAPSLQPPMVCTMLEHDEIS